GPRTPRPEPAAGPPGPGARPGARPPCAQPRRERRDPPPERARQARLFVGGRGGVVAAGHVAGAVGRAAGAGRREPGLGERDPGDDAAVVQQRHHHRQQRGLLAAVLGGGGGEHAGGLAHQGAVGPFGAEAVEEVLQRGRHVAEAGGAPQHQPRALRQVGLGHVGCAGVGHRRRGGGRHRGHRRHGAQARGHAVDLADAARDLARERGHRTAAAVVQDQDLGHACVLRAASIAAAPGPAAARSVTLAAMEPLGSLNRWADRMRDRARAATFARFLWRRFLDDRLFEAAGALSFTTTFALVPLSMVVFGVLSAFPVFEEWRDLLTGFIFANFVPSSAEGIRDWLLSFSGNTGKLTAVGVIALVVSVLVTLFGIESAFNRIWRVHSARPKF